jgi:hypothetical protein
VDPTLRNPKLGLLKCGLSMDYLFFDLVCSSIMYIVLIHLQLLDASSWTSLKGSKKPSNSLDWSVNNSHYKDKEWEEIYDIYRDNMKHVMMIFILVKNIHLKVVIVGPKIQLSSSSTKYLKFKKKTTLIENDASISTPWC